MVNIQLLSSYRFFIVLFHFACLQYSLYLSRFVLLPSPVPTPDFTFLSH